MKARSVTAKTITLESKVNNANIKEWVKLVLIFRKIIFIHKQLSLKI